jgi:hypothetical protein
MGNATTSVTALMMAAVEAGVRSPSPHNTQPSRFRTGADRSELLLDRGRVLLVSAPAAREATLACGAALLNMRMAVAAHGHDCGVELLPDRSRPMLMARLHIRERHRPSPEQVRLAGAIARRCSNRRPFQDRPIPLAVRHDLRTAAAAEGASLVLLERPATLDALVSLLRRAEHIQSGDPRFQAELRAWTHAGDRCDGVPLAAGGPRAAGGGLLALRDFGGECGREREFERHPLVAVLASCGDTRLDALRAGQGMQRVLLAATAAGLNASFLAQPVEVPATRAELRDLLGGRLHPQTVLRLGYGYPAARTPRRPVAEVTKTGLLP